MQQQPPSSFNTDWFGTLLMQGLLDWGGRGIREVRRFADARLGFHLSGKRLSPYSGPIGDIVERSRRRAAKFDNHDMRRITGKFRSLNLNTFLD